MRKFKLFYIAFVLFFSLTGCYDLGESKNNNLHTENQPQNEYREIIPSYTAIYKAIENKVLNEALALLQETLKSDKKVSLIQRDGQGRSLLHFAIANANNDPSQEALYLEIVRLLIELKQDVNARDNEANTPLHIAAKKGLFLIIVKLINSGANVYADNEQRKIPLHCAVEEGHVKVVGLLSARDKTGEIPLILTDSNYIDKKDNHGCTPLYLAVQKFSVFICHPEFGNAENYKFIIDLLIKAEANVYTQNKYGRTLLHIAAEGGCTDILRILIEKKVEINLFDEQGNSPLVLAIINSCKSPKIKDYLMVVNMLIEAGANVHHKDTSDGTLLHIAAMYGNKEIVELLIRRKRKVEINLKDNNGCTPLHLAVEYARNLKEECSLAVVGLLIDAGAMIDSKNDKGHTPLQVAIKNGLPNLVILLISKGANIINSVDDNGNTPLHLAAQNLYMVGFPEVVKLLLDAGADIDVVNKQGNTPFFYMKNYIRQVLF